MNPTPNSCTPPKSAEKAWLIVHSFFQRFSFQRLPFAMPVCGFAGKIKVATAPAAFCFHPAPSPPQPFFSSPSGPVMIRFSLAMVAGRGVLGSVLVLGLCQLAPAGDWPQWRGPLFNGSTAETGLPVEFGLTKNLLWSAGLPGASGATPVVAAERVFVVAADKAGEEVLGMCLDANTGSEHWRHPLCSNHGTPGGNELACNRLGEPQCRSTIVAANGRLYVRGSKNLYCFSNLASGSGKK